MPGSRPRRSSSASIGRAAKRFFAAGLVALAAGCSPVQPEVSQTPIPVALAPGGGLYAYGQFFVSNVAESASPGRLLIDTGSPLSTHGISNLPGDSSRHMTTERLRLYDVPPAGSSPVPRADFAEAPILEAQLSSVGVGADLMSVDGVLGGDLLQKFSLGIDLVASNPTITLGSAETACSCSLACSGAVTLPFTLAGGGTITFDDRVNEYPASRVTLSACIEPVDDPTARGVPCLIDDSFTIGSSTPACPTPNVDNSCPSTTPDMAVAPDAGAPASRHLAPGYERDSLHGAEVRLLVATGFPGLLITSNAWDRVHGYGSARKLLDAGPLVDIHLTRDTPAAGASQTPSTVAYIPVKAVRVKLGTDCSSSSDLACTAALAIVGRESLLGPCGELARSRRIRWSATHPCCDRYPVECKGTLGSLTAISGDNCVGPLPNCSGTGCDDRDQPAAPYVEIAGGLDAWLTDDSASLLQEVNNDIRPQLSDVEGIVGTDLLARLSARIDYPQNRVIARCATGGTGCKSFPRYACHDQVGDCGLRGADSANVCMPPCAMSGKPSPGCPYPKDSPVCALPDAGVN